MLHVGICSRRGAEELILAKRVKVNGKIVTELSKDILENDKVYVDGKLIKLEEEKVYIALNKPVGYITTRSDEYGRKNVIDLIKENLRIYPVGRLDKDTSGLLLLTNDGEAANLIMHPKKEIEKVYVAKVEGDITDEKIDMLKNGVDIGGFVTSKANVKKVNKNTLEITIHEGKNRQVRKMCEAVNLKVVELKRIKEAGIELDKLNIKEGEYVYIKREDIEI